MDGIEQGIDFAGYIGAHAWRLAVAVACGLALGMERERKDKPAGLRTILLISAGSALFMIISNLVAYAYDWPDPTRVDPSRIAAGVVTGIGFLGAGTIIQARGSIQGLTTAAVIWVSAGIGMCAGLGYSELAFLFTGVVVIMLVAMDPFRHRLSRMGHRYDMSVVAPDDSLTLDRIRLTLHGHDVSASDIHVEGTREGELHVSFVYYGYGGAALRLLDALARMEGVHGQKQPEAETLPPSA